MSINYETFVKENLSSFVRGYRRTRLQQKHGYGKAAVEMGAPPVFATDEYASHTNNSHEWLCSLSSTNRLKRAFCWRDDVTNSLTR